MSTLTAMDRCDRCGAQAKHRYVRKPGDKGLMFCQHHTNKHREALEAQGFSSTSDRKLVTS